MSLSDNSIGIDQSQTGRTSLLRRGFRAHDLGAGGEHVGGATELFDAAKDGSMAELLEKSNVAWNTSVDTDPYSFLPGWLQTR